MADEITPALSRAEWRAWHNGRAVTRDERDGSSPERPLCPAVSFDYAGPDVETWDDEEAAEGARDAGGVFLSAQLLIDQESTPTTIGASDLPAVMALANAALPDGHPNKLTRDDAELLQSWSSILSNTDDMEYGGSDLAEIAAKILSLLPSDG